MANNTNEMFMQFSDATGLSLKDYQLISVLEHQQQLELFYDFIVWEKQMKEIGKKYANFLEYLGLDIKDKDNAEIGKSIHDSVVSSFNTTLITPYSDHIPKSRIIPGFFLIENRKPYVWSMESKNILLDNVKTFITQNPYNISELTHWEDLHDNYYNIAVGMFGNFYDKNKKAKLDQLKEFRNKLSSFKDIKMEYITDGDFYASAIVSNRGKVKIK